MRNLGITRQMKDLDRLKTIQAVIDHGAAPQQCANGVSGNGISSVSDR